MEAVKYRELKESGCYEEDTVLATGESREKVEKFVF